MTRRAISPFWFARRVPACARRSGASPLASRRVRAVRTREAGFRLSVSAVLAGTRSRCGHGMYRAGRACPRSARSVDSTEGSGWHRAAARVPATAGRPRVQTSARTSSVSGSSPSGEGMTAAPPGAPGASTASRSAVPDSYLRTRHWLPRLRTRAPIGSSPRVDRYSTSPSGNRSIRIGVVGISRGYR